MTKRRIKVKTRKQRKHVVKILGVFKPKIITGYIEKCNSKMLRMTFQDSASPFCLSAWNAFVKLSVFLNDGTFAMRLWTCIKVSANCYSTWETKVPFQGVWKKLFGTAEELHAFVQAMRVVNFENNKATFVTLFHLGCTQGKNTIRFMENTDSRWKARLTAFFLSANVAIYRPTCA